MTAIVYYNKSYLFGLAFYLITLRMSFMAL